MSNDPELDRLRVTVLYEESEKRRLNPYFILALGMGGLVWGAVIALAFRALRQMPTVSRFFQ